MLLIVTSITLAVVGAFWSSRTYHRFYAVAWPTYTIGYLSLTTLAEIAG